jgi:hypothetical protein
MFHKKKQEHMTNKWTLNQKKNCNTEIAIEPIVTVVAKVREVPRAIQ